MNTTQETPLSEDEKILHLLDRFTPGATAVLVEEVRTTGLKAWFAKQLKGEAKESETLVARVKTLESVGLDAKETYERYVKEPPNATEKEKEETRKRSEIPARELLTWVLLRAVYGANPVAEASTDFFRNHFAVSIDKDEVRHLATDWERRVIRRHALGSFSALLEATAHHAAMLIYLDNHLSRRAPTKSELQMIESEARRTTKSRERGREAVEIARQRGLNENYARELMELHTLGVDRHYTQQDVITVAKCLTGWTVNRGDQRRYDFEFNVEMHATENKVLLGGTIHGERDASEGDLVLQVLAKHKGTALFLAGKLCRHFVNDDPDEKMVMRVAKVFNGTDGDLSKVFTAIVEDPEFFRRGNFRAKFKRPWEFVVSALRATGAEVSSYDGVAGALESMDEPLYRCANPTGYYDQAESWQDPGAMAIRWTFVGDFVAGRIGGAKIPASFWRDLPEAPSAMKEALVRRILPVAGLGAKTSARLDQVIERQKRKDLGPVITGVLLGSPEFQKQ